MIYARGLLPSLQDAAQTPLVIMNYELLISVFVGCDRPSEFSF
ncbi:hypothetical protein [Nostoc sp.]